MTEPNALTVTDIDGGNARHAIGAHVVLVGDDGRILLGLRSETVTLAAGKWSTPCGNLDAGESLRQAAAREACEELGVVIDPADLKFATATHFVNDEGHGPALAAFFTTTVWTGTPQIMEPDKCDALGWYPLDELPEPIVPYVANALADVRAALHNGGVGCGFSEFGWGPVEAPPPGSQLPRERFVARHPRVLASAAMLITDAAGRVLLVDQSYRHDGLWNWPGGGADDDEPFGDAARREVREELGLDIEPGTLLVVDRVPATDRPPMTVYLFDGGTLTDEQVAAITLADGEITDIGFFTPDEAAALLPDHGRRRLRNALAARAGTLPSPDLENGNARFPAIPSRVEDGAVMIGATVWLTGLPGAGKSSIASDLAERLREDGRRVEVLDGDEIRTFISAGLGFSRADRHTNVQRIGFVADLLARNGVTVLVPVIAPYADSREAVRARHRSSGTPFLEVYVAAPVEVCSARDVKGLYALQAAGELTGLTGVDDPYEVPSDPDLRVESQHQTVQVCAAAVRSLLLERGLL